MTAPVLKRADELVVGDRIQPGHLPAYARSGEGVVRYVELYHYRGADWVFAAFATADGDRNCAHYLPAGEVLVIPGGPIGHDLSRPADGGEPQPVAGRIPPHFENGRTGEVVAIDAEEQQRWAALDEERAAAIAAGAVDPAECMDPWHAIDNEASSCPTCGWEV